MSWKNRLQQLLGNKRQFASAEEVERAIGFDRIRNQVWKMLDRMNVMGGAYYYPLDIYLDNGGLYTLLSSEGLLYRADLTVLNDRDVQMGPLQLVVDFSTEAVDRVVTRVFRQADGRYRWFSISATAFLNRVGEIDSTALFDSFIQHAVTTEQYPYRTIIHQDEKLRTGQADLLARDGYCYITSGLFDDSELALVEMSALQNNPANWGESIGYLPTAEPSLWPINERVSIPVYEKGIHVEISTALEKDVSAWFTVPYVTKERMVMNQVVRNTLLQLAKDAGLSEDETEEFVNDFGSRVDSTNQRANLPGSVARANTAVDTPEAPEAVEETEEEAEGVLEIDDTVIEAVVDRMLASEQFTAVISRAQPAVDLTPITERLEQMETAINANFGNLDERLGLLEGEEAERLEDLPAAPQRRVVYRPSQQTSVLQPTNGIFEDSSEELVADGLSKLEKMHG